MRTFERYGLPPVRSDRPTTRRDGHRMRSPRLQGRAISHFHTLDGPMDRTDVTAPLTMLSRPEATCPWAEPRARGGHRRPLASSASKDETTEADYEDRIIVLRAHSESAWGRANVCDITRSGMRQGSRRRWVIPRGNDSGARQPTAERISSLVSWCCQKRGRASSEARRGLACRVENLTTPALQ